MSLNRLLAALLALGLQACTSILHAPDGAAYRSPDGARLAVVDKGRVVLDGRPGPQQFDGINGSGVRFSADGRRVAYLGMRGSQYFLVVDEREHGPFEGIAKGGVRMSPAGRRIALPLVERDRWRMWLDGELSAPVDGFAAEHPVFSPDEAHVGYALRRGEAWFLVVDGFERPIGQGMLADSLGFTAGGDHHVSYRMADGWRVQVGGATSEPFDAINKPGLMIGPGRRAVAFIGRKGEQSFVCVDLACGPPHRRIGTRVPLNRADFADDLLKAMLVGALVGAVTGAAGMPLSSTSTLTTPTSVGTTTYTIVGSVVFSPDERQHAYVATDAADTIMLRGAAPVPVPAGQFVEWMRFDDGSRVLMVRLSGQTRLQAHPLPGTAQHAAPADGADAATLELQWPDGDALVFVDGRFAGVSPGRLAVTPGEHGLEVQAPGRTARRVAVKAVAGQALTLDLGAPADPVRAAVTATIAAFADDKLPTAAKAKAADLVRARVLAEVPLSEEVLGLGVQGTGTDALVFGDRAIYVRSESSTRTSAARRDAVPYAEFARQPLPTDHRAFEVLLTPEVVVKTATLSLSKERLIEFLQTLRANLAALPEFAPRAAR